MATINLAPSTHYIATARKRRRNLFMLTGAVVVLMSVVWIVLALLVQSTHKQKNDLDAQVAAVETQIAAASPDVERITAFQDRLNGLDGLLAQRTSLSPFLQALEQLLPNAAVIEQLNLDSHSGEVRIQGNAPSLDDISQAVASLNRTPNQIFRSVTIKDSRRVDAKDTTPAHYSFNLTIQLQPQALFTNVAKPS